MFVKPATGLVIRDPDLRDLLPETGRDVPDTGYWQRRVRDADVVETEPAAQSIEAVPTQLPAPINTTSDKGTD